MTPQQTLDLILSKCREDGGCWIWQGALQSCGTTPTIRIPGTRKVTGVRRLVLQCCRVDLHGKFATNTCESPLCVAPDHLKAMTRLELQQKTYDNLPLSTKLKRQKAIAEAQRAKAKLTPELVEMIKQSSRSTRDIAEDLGVSQHTVWAARTGKCWAPLVSANPFAQLML